MFVKYYLLTITDISRNVAKKYLTVRAVDTSFLRKDQIGKNKTIAR